MEYRLGGADFTLSVSDAEGAGLDSRSRGRQISGALLGCLLAALLGATSPLAEGSPTVTYAWQPPTVGTPVAHYVLELAQVRGEETVSRTVVDSILVNSYAVTVEQGLEYHIRVAGVDADGNQGPWSLWSDLQAPPEEFPDGSPGN